MSEHKKYRLPSSWLWTELREVGIVAAGGTPSTKESVYWSGELPWITPADLTGYKAKFISKGRKSITQEGLDRSSAKMLPQGTVLFSSRAPIGYVAIANNPISTNQGFKNLIVTEFLSSDYVFYYLKSVKQLAESMASGTTFLEISGTRFGQIPIPLPPLNEQNRIVDKIEELFSELDNGVKNLKLAQNQLKVYRHALLKHAFEGKLTEEWCKKNNPKPAEKLLDRIQKEREERYENELKDWKDVVKAWEKDGKKGKKPRQIKKSNLQILNEEQKLPKGWFWGDFENSVVNYDSDRIPLSRGIRANRKGSFPYFGATGIVDNIDDFIFDGEYLLIGEDGANLLSKARDLAFIVRGKFWVNNHAHILQPLIGMSMSYLCFYINSLSINKYVSGTAQPKLNQANLNKIPIPYCSYEEQLEIVSILESQFSIIDNNEITNASEIQKSELLRQSILKKAFEGKLIPQDKVDEPASELLKKIRLAKEKYLEEQKELRKAALKKKKVKMKKPSIEYILKNAKKPMKAELVWQESEHHEDIEKFYDALKELGDRLKETKTEKGAELILKK